jgi:poly[(R)-3-hydroxyalkanoate] polymerase subunit PhaE
MNSPWNKDWLAAQRQYMEALASFGSTAAQKQSVGAQIPEWQKTLDNWWQNSLSALPEDSQPIFSNLLQHSKSWYAITDQFNELLKTISAGDEKVVDWQGVLAEHIDKMKSQLQDGFVGNDIGLWQNAMQSPLDSWQAMVNGMPSTSGASTAGIQPGNPQAIFENYFSLPGIGQNREAHEQIREGLRLWQTCQNNYQAYRETLDKLGLISLDKLQEKILSLADKENSISSLRDIYDLWVDSHEEAYADYVLTEEYSKLYGQLVNSMLAFRGHSNQFVSDSLKDLNLPTTDQLDVLQKQQHELRQELRDLNQQQEQDKKRIKALEDKIKKLDATSAPVASFSRPQKKKTRKKKVIRKTASTKSGNTLE